MSHSFNEVADGVLYDEKLSRLKVSLTEALRFDVPFDPTLYRGSQIWDVKYNGREMLAVGTKYVPVPGVYQPLMFRYRDGVWSDISSLIVTVNAIILRAVDWDGEKWWIAARDYNNASCPLYTLDMYDNVVDHTGSIGNMTVMNSIKVGGRYILVGGYTPINIPRLWKIEGATYTEITASLQGTANVIAIDSIDYYDGVWMIGGRKNVGNQAWLNTWDESVFTDLSANLPNDAYNRTRLEYISHNDSYWVFGIGTESTLVKFDGTTWTSYIYPGSLPVRYAMGIKPVWTGHEWFLFYSYAVKWDGASSFTNVSSLFPKPNYPPYVEGMGITYGAEFAEGKVIVIPITEDVSDPIHYDRVYYGYQLGPAISSSLVDRRNQTSQFINTLNSGLVCSDMVCATKRMNLPTYGAAGAPPWTGSDGDMVVNINDNKLYWWANGAWRASS